MVYLSTKKISNLSVKLCKLEFTNLLAEFSCGSTDESNWPIPFFYFWLCVKRRKKRRIGESGEEGGRKEGKKGEGREKGRREEGRWGEEERKKEERKKKRRKESKIKGGEEKEGGESRKEGERRKGVRKGRRKREERGTDSIT